MEPAARDDGYGRRRHPEARESGHDGMSTRLTLPAGPLRDGIAQSSMSTTASTFGVWQSLRLGRCGGTRWTATSPVTLTTRKELHVSIQRLNDASTPPNALGGVVSQPWARDRFDWYDAAAQYEVALQMQAGWCAIATIPLGAAPGRDRQVEHNQAHLDALPAPFSAWCASGSEDEDGWLEWAESMSVVHSMQDEERLALSYPPSGIPLEIGHTEPETTIFHLRRDGGVARWPYHHQHITLLLSTGAVESGPVQLAAPTIVAGAETVARRVQALEPAPAG